ncbi:MAG TPA: hypothetical protein VGO07_02195 [Candidatus Saccharimonadales bacterium]|nr:hypothetical protein [Candidatus Saccharimonadales bacterium]
MIPAVIWAASSYSAHDLSKVIGGFPFYYLAVSQLLVMPRYIAGAIVVERLSKSKHFSVKRGIIGLLAVGFVIDIWMTFAFARAIGAPGHNWPFGIPVMTLAWGLLAMVFVAAISGFTARWDKPVLSSKIRKRR